MNTYYHYTQRENIQSTNSTSAYSTYNNNQPFAMDDQAIAIERPQGRGAGAEWTVKQTFQKGETVCRFKVL
jgi:hypothetical protein